MIVLWVTTGGEHLLASVKAKGLEWILTLAAVLFGYALIQPGSTFSLSPAHATMAALAAMVRVTEEQIGWSMIMVGIVRLAILAYNGLWTSSPIARRWLAYLFLPLWFLIFVGIFNSVGLVSTGNIYLALLAGEVVNVVRTSWESGQVPRLARGKVVKHDDPRN